jgi:hypothetical protein
VARSTDDHRNRIHVAAVIVGNFTNYLYALAEDYCKKENLDFHSLYPLIIETAQRMKNSSPSDVQTCPAMRHDNETIDLSESIWSGF